MRKIFSTAEVRPHERFDSWHEAARRYVIDHDSRPECRRDFEANLCSAVLDEMTFFSLQASPMTVSHTSSHAAQADPDGLFVCRQLGGTLLVEQDSREIALHSGEMTLLDPLVPYKCRFLSGTSLLVIKVPRRRLEARTGNSRNLIARLMRPSQGANGLASDLLALLPQHAEHLGKSGSAVADKALDLLAVALAATCGTAGPRVSSARFVVLARLRSAIERRLTDFTLDPASAAAAAGISVRYANAVLSDENTSVARLIQTRRLERCRQALGDSTQAHRSISDIAYGWGFSDMTHFGRRFKQAYGVLPSEYRKTQSPPCGQNVAWSVGR
jgi:AraC family transcriptional regulator, positive regulator of tynA and feaB